MEMFLPILYGAFVVEAIVNIVRSIEEKQKNWRYWTSLGLGLGLGVVVSLNYDLDFFTVLGLEGKVPIIGAVMTGLIVGRGSNFVSDLVGLIRKSQGNGD